MTTHLYCNYHGNNTFRTVTYLKLALEVIRSWPAISANIRVKEPPPLDYLDDISNPVVEEKQVPLRSTDRTLLESFLFNYSIIFLCQKEWLLELGSPFDIFNEFRPFLKTPLYQCPVPWMNNPVVGAALCAIELVAKASWLWYYYPFNLQHESLAVQVHSAAKYFIVPLLPPDVKFVQPKHVRRRLEDSCCTARIMAKAVYCLLTKLLYPRMDASKRPGKVGVPFPNLFDMHIVVCGHTFVNDSSKRSGLAHVENREFCFCPTNLLFLAVESFLNGTWGTKGNPGQGWNVLLKKNCFKKVMF
ncbi:hypothetical protein KL908_000938 [Ogataea polymorpha]|nr:hypothetical protein KL908_000938 [Ogataea polymorpha]